MWRCCFNPKVLVGLAAVGATLWLLNPASIGALLPTLVLLVCPLSMGVMMWRMRSGGSCSATSPGGDGAADTDTEIRALRTEIAGLRAQAAPGSSADAPVPSAGNLHTPAH